MLKYPYPSRSGAESAGLKERFSKALATFGTFLPFFRPFESPICAAQQKVAALGALEPQSKLRARSFRVCYLVNPFRCMSSGDGMLRSVGANIGAYRFRDLLLPRIFLKAALQEKAPRSSGRAHMGSQGRLPTPPAPYACGP